MFKRAYVEITNVCNLRCSFCPGTTRAPRAMTPDEFRIIAQKLRAQTDYLYFHVMGEPLLHPDLPELLQIADEMGFRVCLTTNGTLLGKCADALCAAPALHKVSISLHSFEGNGGADLTGYLETVWAFCRRADCIVSLRLWNKGGADRRNEEIETFFSRKTGLDVQICPATPPAIESWAKSSTWRAPRNSTGPIPPPPNKAWNSATVFGSRSPFCATARWYPAA